MRPNRVFCVSVAAVAVAFVSPGPVQTGTFDRFAGEPEAAEPQQCAGAIDVPVRLTLQAPGRSALPGSELVVEAEITAHADIEALYLSLEVEGDMDLFVTATHHLGTLRAGESWIVEIPVRLPLDGRGAVSAQLLADEACWRAVREERELSRDRTRRARGDGRRQLPPR